MDPTQISCRVFFPYWGFFCYVIALDVPLVLAGGLLYHVLLVLVLARLKLFCSSLFHLSITLHFLAGFSGLCSDRILCKLSLSSVLVFPPHV